uniref:Uncharacterized protein n=2 Tax=Spongospora subterranea TaxID=70186 RepID=A0A0H5R6K0_9EUKA|eukprot:CRZ09402.1 hypothetical protein [Spongospora subterranea]
MRAPATHQPHARTSGSWRNTMAIVAVVLVIVISFGGFLAAYLVMTQPDKPCETLPEFAEYILAKFKRYGGAAPSHAYKDQLSERISQFLGRFQRSSLTESDQILYDRVVGKFREYDAQHQRQCEKLLAAKLRLLLLAQKSLGGKFEEVYELNKELAEFREQARGMLTVWSGPQYLEELGEYFIVNEHRISQISQALASARSDCKQYSGDRKRRAMFETTFDRHRSNLLKTMKSTPALLPHADFLIFNAFYTNAHSRL